jgi:dTDP-4-dehydrorhamnose 3,5-epimerase
MSAIDQFVKDGPFQIATTVSSTEEVTIGSVQLLELGVNTDSRGDLIELMTSRDGDFIDFQHAYQVLAEAGSFRGWIYHKLQSDRICFTQGDFEVELVDLTRNQLHAETTWS